MTTKTTYKVGDKVRVLDARKILGGSVLPEMTEVTKMDGNGNLYLRTNNGHNVGLYIMMDELKYIEKVAEQVAKFKVGDKVRIIKDMGGIAGVKIGTIATVTEVDSDGDVRVDVINKNGIPAFFLSHEVEIAPQKLTKNQRITTLEQTVADLQAEIDALKAAQKPKSILSGEGTLIFDGKPIGKVSGISYKSMTPNEQRKALIDEAKAFVKDNLAKNHPHTLDDGLGAWFVSEGGVFSVTTKVDFVINSEKRTVVALVKGIHNKNVRGKGIAKCNPSDVFNADIGKAIALGRALGLDVERFEKAVQPSEIVVGQVVKGREETGRSDFEASVTSMFPSANGRGHGAAFHHSGGLGWLGEKQVHIIDDTEAQY